MPSPGHDDAHPGKTRVLAGFCLEIDECIAFWRVLGEGPEVVKSLESLLIRRAKYLAKTRVLARSPFRNPRSGASKSVLIRVLRGFQRATPPKPAFWQVFAGKSMNVSRFGAFWGRAPKQLKSSKQILSGAQKT